MSDNNLPPLTPDLISDPKMHRLGLMVSESSVHVTVSSRINENECVTRTIEFKPEASDAVAALEEAVYDNPLLIADFHAVDVIVDNNRFFVMDIEKATEQEIRRRIDALWPPERHKEEFQPLVSEIEENRTVLVSAIPRKLLSFLRRTWNSPVIMHRMAVLSRYHALKNHLGNMGKIHIRLLPERLDIVAFGRDGLLLANSFAINAVDDAVYYTLMAAQHLGFDNDTERILVQGAPETREEYIDTLRRFISNVMPEMFAAHITQKVSGTPLELLLVPYF